jgi:hypothetical protein
MVAEMIEDYDWESDESEDWESDEAFAESEDSAEDIGEARRRRRGRYYQPGRMSRPGIRGVQGLRVRGQDGRVTNMAFPARVATAAETNRGLANQDLARRALAERLNRLEVRARALQRKDSSVSGLVTLALGGGLATFGAIQAVKKTGNTGLQRWAAEPSTRTASVVSAAQLITTGAKLVTGVGYARSPIAITADLYSAAQLAVFAFGSLNIPNTITGAENDIATANKNIGNYSVGSLVLVKDTGLVYQVVTLANGASALQVTR